MHKERVVVVIPTYNEALVIERTVLSVFHALDVCQDYDCHLLIVDSASQDDTQNKVKILQEHYPQLHLLTEQKKTGLGSAYYQAMNYALDKLNADILIEFDADLSHQPKYLPLMLEKIKTCDVVIGSRYVEQGCIPGNWGWHRKLLSWLGNLTARLILTNRYKDFTSGFKASRRQCLQEVLPQGFLSNHYAYKLHLLWMLHKIKAKIVEMPIEFLDRELGSSKLPGNSIYDSLRVILILRWQALKSGFIAS